MIEDTLLLFTLQWQRGWNEFRQRRFWSKLAYGIGLFWLVGGGGAISAGIGFGAGAILRSFPELGLDALLPGLILTAVTLILLLTSFGNELGSLFLARDLELLMVAPVDRRAVFITKVLDGINTSFLLVLALATPALVTYGISLGLGPLYYLAMALTLAGAPLFPAGLGALLVLVVARYAPVSRIREVLGLAAAVAGITCSLLGQTSRFWGQRLAASGTDPAALLEEARGLQNLPIPPFVAGFGLAAAGRGDLVGAAAGLAGFFALTFGFFAGCVWVANRLYEAGWVRLKSGGTAKRKHVASRDRRPGWQDSTPVPVSIALKDWRLVTRDLRNFAQLLWPLLLLPVTFVNIIGGRRGPAESIQQALGNSVNPTPVFVCIGILAVSGLLVGRFAATSISIEGQAWWIMRSAPVTATEIISGKLFAVVAPFVALSTLLLVSAAIWQQYHPLWAFYGWVSIEMLGIGSLVLAVGFSVPWARLDWETPRQMSSGWGQFFAFISQIGLGLVAGALICLPVLMEAFAPELLAAGIAMGLLGATVITGAASWAALSLALARLSFVGEPA